MMNKKDVSIAESKPQDFIKSTELLEVLQQFQIFESEAELNQRLEILAKLNILFKRWIFEVAIAQEMSEEAAQQLGGNIYTFGSYLLGVHQKGSDIDAVCVAPKNIDRSEYFSSFFELLKQQPEVSECRAIQEAFVPVIKLKFNGIEIDLLFASLSLNEIPDDLNLHDDNLLKNLDVRSVRSLNGFRVTDEILNLVPNIENYRLALRTIKLWAKRNGIYSNSLGYFGGVTWAMLVARTCQLYPTATASTLVHRFFMVVSQWNWPNPILLKCLEDTNLGFPVWDPRINVSDRFHLMPVITPSYPQQNSTFNVTQSTKKIMLHEFLRGRTITEQIMLGTATWDRLFETPSFFHKYHNFAVLLVKSQNAEDHLKWCGLVESKVRFLVGQLERNPLITLAHVNTKCFNLKKSKRNSSAFNNVPTSMWFVGLNLKRNENLNLDLIENNFTRKVYSHAEKINALKDGMTIEVGLVKRKYLNQYLDVDILKNDKNMLNTIYNNREAAVLSSKRHLSPELDRTRENQIKRTRISESQKEDSYNKTNYWNKNRRNNWVDQSVRYNSPSTSAITCA